MTRRRRIAHLAIVAASPLSLLIVAGLTAWASSLATEGGWPPPIEVSQSGDLSSRGPDLILEDDGTLHAIWMERAPVASPLTFTLFHASSTDGGRNWSFTLPLTPSGVHRYEGAADIDDYGGLHLIWHEAPGEYQVWYGQLLDTGWEEQVMISSTEYMTTYVVGPDVEVAGDWIHALWSEVTFGTGGTSKRDLFYSRSEGGEIWTATTLELATNETSDQLRIAADQNDNIHVVWQENARMPNPREIMYISGTVYTTDTVWSTPVTVSLGLSESAVTPNIAVGSDGVVHVVFAVETEADRDVQDVYYAHFPIWDTGSISATLIPHSRVEVSSLLPTDASPAIALSGTDSVHVVWNGIKPGDFADRVYYSVSGDGGTTWSEPVPATPRDTWPDCLPDLAVDGEFVHLLFLEKVSGADQDVYYTKRFPVKHTCPLGLKSY
jgi:hypothetical protein